MTHSIFVGGKIYNINQRDNDHRLTRSKKVRVIREAAAELWVAEIAEKGTIGTPVAVVGQPYSVRPIDVDSPHPMLKAILDGLVDARGIPDDSARYVASVTLKAYKKATAEEVGMLVSVASFRGGNGL